MEIIITEKDDTISWEEVTEVLHSAHKTTLEKGMRFKAASQTPEETQERLGKDGKFVVATVDGKLAGVGAVTFKNINEWYGKGKVAKFDMLGVSNDFKGMGIASEIDKKREKIAFENSDLIVTDTAEQNEIILKSYEKRDWFFVGYESFKGTNYYSICMAKWKDGCPFSNTKRKVFFIYEKIKCKLLRDSDGKLRIRRK